MKIEVLKKDKEYVGSKYGFYRIVTGRKNIKSKPIYFDKIETLIAHVKPLMRKNNSYTFIKSINYDNKEFKVIMNTDTQDIEKLGEKFSNDPTEYYYINGETKMQLLAYIKQNKLNKLIDKI